MLRVHIVIWVHRLCIYKVCLFKWSIPNCDEGWNIVALYKINRQTTIMPIQPIFFFLRMSMSCRMKNVWLLRLCWQRPHARVNETQLMCVTIDWEMPLHPLILYMNSIAFHSIHKCRLAKSIIQSSLCFDTWQCCCFYIKGCSYPMHKLLLWWNSMGMKHVEVFMFRHPSVSYL